MIKLQFSRKKFFILISQFSVSLSPRNTVTKFKRKKKLQNFPEVALPPDRTTLFGTNYTYSPKSRFALILSSMQ